MKKIDYTELGGTLFVPAIHKDLDAITLGIKYPNLKSVVIDFEDSIKEEDYKQAFNNLAELLNYLEYKSILVFIRPRNTTSLQDILNLKNITRIDAFILPKFSIANSQQYLQILEKTNFLFMPSIEGDELFDAQKLINLKNILLNHKKNIILIRFGLEDILKQLGMKRLCNESIFDYSITSNILGTFLSIFKSAGFAISGGVYPYFKDDEGFVNDIKRDIKEGLFSKTIIHPNQIEITNNIYKVSKKEFDEALEIVYNSKAVFNQNTKMAEKKTMTPYSLEIIKRAEVYGVI